MYRSKLKCRSATVQFESQLVFCGERKFVTLQAHLAENRFFFLHRLFIRRETVFLIVHTSSTHRIHRIRISCGQRLDGLTTDWMRLSDAAVWPWSQCIRFLRWGVINKQQRQNKEEENEPTEKGNLMRWCDIVKHLPKSFFKRWHYDVCRQQTLYSIT